MVTSRYPRRGQRLAPQLLRQLLAIPLPQASLPAGARRDLLLCDLDEGSWKRFEEPVCHDLARQIVQAVAARIRTPSLGGHRLLPPVPEGLTLTDLDLEVRTLNCLAGRPAGASAGSRQDVARRRAEPEGVLGEVAR